MDISGVLSDSSLYAVLKPGPSYLNERLNSYWPELEPGFFKAGSNSIYYGFDYLYSNEARLISAPITGLAEISTQISHTFGPILAAYCPSTSVSGDLSIIESCTTGWVSRDSNFTPLIYASCRLRLYHNMDEEGSWDLLSTGSTYKIYRYTVPAETNGFGTLYDPIPLKVSDSTRDWKNLGNLEDIVACGGAGLNEWAVGSSGTILFKRSISDSQPTGLAVTWLAGQASMDYEEIGLSTTEGTPISLGTKSSVTDCYVQFPRGGCSASGFSISPYVTLPRLINTVGIPANTELVIRYRPTEVYSSFISTSGVQLVTRVPSRSICLFRYEQSTKKSLFPAGSFPNNIVNSIDPLTSLPAFLIGVAPGHILHSSKQNQSYLYGATLIGSKVIAWASHTELYLNAAPARLKIMVLGPDDIPIPNVSIELTPSSGIAIPLTTIVSNNEGNAFTEVTKTIPTTGVATLSISIYNLGVLIDSKTINFSLNNNTDLWKSRLVAGTVIMEVLPYSVRSGFSNRKQLAIYRISADGTPSVYSSKTLKVFCSKGRLFSYLNNNIVLSNNGSGKELILSNTSTTDMYDKPIILEYEEPSSGEVDTIYCEWSSEEGIPNAYGSLKI